MGAALGIDKIGTLSHSSGIITLNVPAGQQFNVITIGGQQYRIGALSRTISTDVSLSINTLYLIFAVVVGGTVQLRISTNLNSFGPSGFSAWNLIGAFYSNGLGSPSFGAFISDPDLEPTTPWIEGGPNIITGSSSNPSIGNGGSPPTNRFFWRRRGPFIDTYHEYAHNTAGTVGSGAYLFQMPFTFDQTRYNTNSDSFSGVNGSWNAYSEIGKGHVTTAGSTGFMIIQPYSFGPPLVRFWIEHMTTAQSVATGGWGSNFFTFSNVDLEFSFDTTFQAQGLTGTPLRKL